MRGRIKIGGLLIIFFASACGQVNTTTPFVTKPIVIQSNTPAGKGTRPPKPTNVPSPTPIPPTLTSMPTQNPAQGDGRIVILSEVVGGMGDVSVCDDNEGYCGGAIAGMQVALDKRVTTLEESFARLDISPDNTVIRLTEVTTIKLLELSASPQTPFTKFNLGNGQMWVILKKGSLDVETDIGLAKVSEGYMGVYFDTLRIIMTVTCLEGECSLVTPYGTSNLKDGRAADIPAPGQPPSAAREMTRDEYRGWYDNNPEIEH